LMWTGLDALPQDYSFFMAPSGDDASGHHPFPSFLASLISPVSPYGGSCLPSDRRPAFAMELGAGERVGATMMAAGLQGGCHTPGKTWSPRECQLRSMGSAWGHPPARLGEWAGVPMGKSPGTCL